MEIIEIPKKLTKFKKQSGLVKWLDVLKQIHNAPEVSVCFKIWIWTFLLFAVALVVGFN